MSFYNVVRGFAAIVLRPFFKIHVEYAEPLPPDRGYILACNHMSDWDPVLLAIAFPGQLHYMAKEELFHIPVLGAVIRGVGAFPVARGKGDTGAIDCAVTVVKNGGVLGIFPEGGRSKDGKLRKVKSGTAVIAAQTGGDILPTVILYCKRCFLRRHVILRFGKVIRNDELHIVSRSKSELRAANELLGGRLAGLLENR